MATPEEMKENMPRAEAALKELDPEAVRVVGQWWINHYRDCGHRNLGRHLVYYFKEELPEPDEVKTK